MSKKRGEGDDGPKTGFIITGPKGVLLGVNAGRQKGKTPVNRHEWSSDHNGKGKPPNIPVFPTEDEDLLKELDPEGTGEVTYKQVSPDLHGFITRSAAEEQAKIEWDGEKKELETVTGEMGGSRRRRKAASEE